MKIYTYWFDLPLYSLVPYISERLMLETDFVNEANNSETMKKLVADEVRDPKSHCFLPAASENEEWSQSYLCCSTVSDVPKIYVKKKLTMYK